MKDKERELYLVKRLGDQLLAVIGDWEAEHELTENDGIRLEFLCLMGMLNSSPMMGLLAGVVKIEDYVEAVE